MRLSTIMFSLSAASIALASYGIWGFSASFAPVPGDLKTIVGRVSEVEAHTVLYSKAHATFRVTQANGKQTDFMYTPYFKKFYYFAENVKEGMMVEVTTDHGGKQDFWGLKLESHVLMTPTEAREARISDGRWSLALFVAFFMIAVWSIREGLDHHRKGI